MPFLQPLIKPRQQNLCEIGGPGIRVGLNTIAAGCAIQYVDFLHLSSIYLIVHVCLGEIELFPFNFFLPFEAEIDEPAWARLPAVDLDDSFDQVPGIVHFFNEGNMYLYVFVLARC